MLILRGCLNVYASSVVGTKIMSEIL